MKKFLPGLLALLVAAATYTFLAPAASTDNPSDPVAAVQPDPDARPKIQVALLLDTSGSMDGLIDQARSQLWRIINRLGEARHNGQAPIIEVALYEYGNAGLSPASGYVRQVSPMTTDLDGLSEKLFSLTTNGGDEYCGQVISQALREIDWSRNQNDLRMIFIAGNEPFDQGPTNFQEVCSLARQSNIRVNTIYCGADNSPESGLWRQGAEIGNGEFAWIDHNAVVAQIAAPQDERIVELGNKLNDTYIPYGDQGVVSYKRQAAQDASSVKVNSSVSRSLTKASGYYQNEKWDLVDAYDKDKGVLEEVDAGDLPAPMQSMNSKERREYVKKNKELRNQYQAEITSLKTEREAYLRDHQSQEQKTLDAAMVKSVSDQAKTQGYTFGK
ncbi:MAG: VWA domain-containing protein [Candidatus Eremiobacteraeota bacterium]|nr:VWA domain-containing protein [Candidatus Eremiobacteraeota bacterium]